MGTAMEDGDDDVEVNGEACKFAGSVAIDLDIVSERESFPWWSQRKTAPQDGKYCEGYKFPLLLQSSSQKAISFATAINPGQEIDAYGVGKVVASGNPEFEKDDLVVGLITWGEYSLLKGGNHMLRKFDPMGFPLSCQVGILVCKPKKGDKVFVSAASGSVGNVVGQYAKLFGCYVVGCAGSKDKVALLKEKLGFDDAFNYKEEPDLKTALGRYFPDGIDIYFDNVGGDMLEAAVVNMNCFGRVAVCGVISEYGVISTTTDHLRTATLHALEDISEGVESFPSAFWTFSWSQYWKENG